MGIEWLKPAVFFGSIAYALIGVVIFWLCFIIIDKITRPGPGGGRDVPGHLDHRRRGDARVARAG